MVYSKQKRTCGYIRNGVLSQFSSITCERADIWRALRTPLVQYPLAFSPFITIHRPSSTSIVTGGHVHATSPVEQKRYHTRTGLCWQPYQVSLVWLHNV